MVCYFCLHPCSFSFCLQSIFSFPQKLRINNSKCYYNARGEELLRQSGLTYTIIRVEGFNNLPGGVQAVEVKQVGITKNMEYHHSTSGVAILAVYSQATAASQHGHSVTRGSQGALRKTYL